MKLLRIEKNILFNIHALGTRIPPHQEKIVQNEPKSTVAT